MMDASLGVGLTEFFEGDIMDEKGKERFESVN
jgi:hypothetical protein